MDFFTDITNTKRELIEKFIEEVRAQSGENAASEVRSKLALLLFSGASGIYGAHVPRLLMMLRGIRDILIESTGGDEDVKARLDRAFAGIEENTLVPLREFDRAITLLANEPVGSFALFVERVADAMVSEVRGGPEVSPEMLGAIIKQVGEELDGSSRFKEAYDHVRENRAASDTQFIDDFADELVQIARAAKKNQNNKEVH